jgi:hypothetical protein
MVPTYRVGRGLVSLQRAHEIKKEKGIIHQMDNAFELLPPKPQLNRCHPQRFEKLSSRWPLHLQQCRAGSNGHCRA